MFLAGTQTAYLILVLKYFEILSEGGERDQESEREGEEVSKQFHPWGKEGQENKNREEGGLN